MKKKISIVAVILGVIILNIGIVSKLFTNYEDISIIKNQEGSSENIEYSFENINKDILHMNYIKTLDQTKITKLNFTPIISRIEDISNNRNYYDSEKEQLPQMYHNYFNEGIRASSKIDNIHIKDSVYYDSEKNMLIYPDKAMSDDDLLKIIDFNVSINLLLSQNITTPDVDLDISANDAEKIATEMVEILYNINPIDFNISSGFNERDELKFWSISFEPVNVSIFLESEYISYFVDVDSRTGSIVYIDSYDGNRNDKTEEISEVNNLVAKSFATESNKILQKIKPNSDFKLCEQYIPILKMRSIYSVFKTQEGIYCEVELEYPSKDLIGFKMYSNEDEYKFYTQNKVSKFLT